MTTNKIRVLGYDPGFGRVGASLIDYFPNTKTFKLASAFLLETNSTQPFNDRVSYIYNRILDFIKISDVDQIVYEDCGSLKGENGSKVNRALGGLLVVAGNLKIPTTEYSPTKIKNVVTGSGKADKKMMEASVRKILAMDKEEKYIDDVFDAMGCALCYISSNFGIKF